MKSILSIAVLLFAFGAVAAPMTGCEATEEAGDEIEEATD